ncbi:MAG: hypothetical protein ACQERB_13345, partial [Promethearchaeati archaeon]
MIERLYQPDYSCIFGERFGNAFLYPQIDSLMWPIFKNCEKSDKLKNLLSLKNAEGHPYFYHRNLNLDDLKVELQCSNIELAFLQALNLGREYGIENKDLLNVAKKAPELFKAILSFTLTTQNENLAQKIKEINEIIDVVGIVLYPSYTMLDLNNLDNTQLNRLLDYVKKECLFLKIDIGNIFFPNYYSGFISKEIIQSFVSNHLDIRIILSGLDISGDLGLYYQLMRYYNNLWLELDPRCIGGMTPTKYFKNLFSIDGFIQNTWHRIIVGSASPTLEISQIYRGLLEATEDLSFSQKSLLRTWVFRNAARLNSNIYEIPEEKKHMFKTLLDIKQEKVLENENEINISYKLKLRSYSITQLIFLTNIIKEIFSTAKQRFPEYKEGTLFLKS